MTTRINPLASTASGSAVDSVNGRTGAVSLDKTDVGLTNVDNTSDANKPVSTAAQTALDLKQNVSQSINAQSGTTYTFVLGDAGKLVSGSSASATVFTVPLNASVAYPTGTRIDVARVGAGSLTIAATGGVTINSKSGFLALSPRYGAARLTKTATDTWLLTGDLA